MQHRIVLSFSSESRRRLKVDGLNAHEASLPSKFDMNIKAFCLYHKADYDNRFTREQKQVLLEHHGREIRIKV